MDIGQEGSVCTPRRAQKCLFASGDDSGKKNIPEIINCNKDIEVSSGEESDLGPMSPLAFTDRSPNSYFSSPDTGFISPLGASGRSTLFCATSWDRLNSSPRSDTEGCTSSFSSLKKLTRDARYSPKCKLDNNNFTTSLPSSPCKPMESMLSTPKSSKMDSADNEIIPETPLRSFEIQNQDITETPRKGRSPEYRLRTPLGSITKLTLLPKLHRRKSVDALETSENFSPEEKENTRKRHLHDQTLNPRPVKLFKANDACMPKARAALFQEEKSETNSKDFSLSTKTFYNSCRKFERPFLINVVKNSNIKKRRSLPVYNNRYGRTLKKYRFDRINAGVSHGIKRPKPKTSSETLKKNVERASLPEIDESKRFFKNTGENLSATITINDKIKFNVVDGKIELNKKHRLSSTVRKYRAKDTRVSYDTTDLSVDEPKVEAALEQNKIINILKILEDDWADDDYDTMGTLTVSTNTVSPLKSATVPREAIMSPASELSSMTSTMNIKDVAPLTDIQNLSLDNNNSTAEIDNNNSTAEINKEPREKYFPLFTKKYSASENIFKYVLWISVYYKNFNVSIVFFHSAYCFYKMLLLN